MFSLGSLFSIPCRQNNLMVEKKNKKKKTGLGIRQNWIQVLALQHLSYNLRQGI